jgi:hypothetical protein
VPAAGHHRVQLLPRLLLGHQAVHRVRRDALGAVDRRGVAEPGRLLQIVNWQPDDQVAADVPDGQVAPPMRVMVQRSPFLTRSVAERRSRRSLAR